MCCYFLHLLKTAILKNFAIFTGKHLCRSLFLTKVQAWKSAALLKRDSNTGVFLWILRIFKNTYIEKHLRTTTSGVTRKMLLRPSLEAYSEPSQRSKMVLFAEIVSDGWKSLTIFATQKVLSSMFDRLYSFLRRCKKTKKIEPSFSCIRFTVGVWGWIDGHICLRLYIFII